MGKKIRVIGVIAIGVMVIVGVALYWHHMKRKNESFSFRDHLNETVLQVNDTEISLGDASFYIMSVEDSVNQMAITYNSNQPQEFWNTHYSAGADSVFMRDYAKTTAQDQCIYEYVLSMEAASVITLTDAEQVAAKEEAKDFYDKMDERQRKVTGLTNEQLIKIYERRKVNQKYLSYLSKDGNLGIASSEFSKELNYNGNYYKENILSKYKVQRNTELWDRISMGTITVN
jgi:hypothetical protein